MTDRQTIQLLGISIDVLTRDRLFRSIGELLGDGGKHIVTYVNIHTMNTAVNDGQLRDLYRRSSLTYCDGAGVVWGARLMNAHLPERMTSASFVYDFCDRWQDDHISLFFLGGRPGIAARASRSLLNRFPQLRIAGHHHGYFKRYSEEEEQVISTISSARPDILFLGLGTPEQEHWLLRNFERLEVKVAWVVGALADYLADAVPRSPEFMQSHDMEWLFRLVLEPRRMFKRYVVGNPLFLMRILRERMTRQ